MRLAAVLLALALFSGPMAAAQDDWPALYDVSGVATDDVLNVRAAPSASAAIVGALPPDATGIEVLRVNETGTWGRVNAGEGAGWVSLRFLARQPGQSDGGIPEIARCFGTEPFWSLSLNPPGFALEFMGEDPAEGLISGLWRSSARTDRFALAGSTGPGEGRSLQVILSLRKAICSDGMSDREYGFDLDLLLIDEQAGEDQPASGLWSGCCTLAGR